MVYVPTSKSVAITVLLYLFDFVRQLYRTKPSYLVFINMHIGYSIYRPYPKTYGGLVYLKKSDAVIEQSNCLGLQNILRPFLGQKLKKFINIFDKCRHVDCQTTGKLFEESTTYFIGGHGF